MRISMRSNGVGLVKRSIRATMTARSFKLAPVHHVINGRKQSACIVAYKRGAGHVARYRAEATTEPAVEEELTIELPLECQQVTCI